MTVFYDHFPGLSPRPRGSLRVRSLPSGPRGSIPASAGKPRSPRTNSNTKWVYPRVRGEAALINRFAAGRRGLSPRPRGSRPRLSRPCPGRGSIPASAGKPAMRHIGEGLLKVYPRVRGEAVMNVQSRLPEAGLSPRPRGSPALDVGNRHARRSIPASAGKPAAASAGPTEPRVYPRVRGEADNFIFPASYIGGLSPRPRGSPLPTTRYCRRRGSIPASAGKPAADIEFDEGFGVYPRVRGEAGVLLIAQQHLGGLSPRPRGSPTLAAVAPVASRSIPASAGKPSSWRATGERSRVYPRVRGEADVPPCDLLCQVGLSPRPRGSLANPLRLPSGSGSIPASAGKPGYPCKPRPLVRVYPRVRGEA